jgi:hypothetical protein
VVGKERATSRPQIADLISMDGASSAMNTGVSLEAIPTNHSEFVQYKNGVHQPQSVLL